MQGAFFLAWPKRSRTRDAPTPTNISTNSEPDAETKGTPASPATARARSVLPVPGGPSMITPLGIFAPSAEYLAGSFRKSTTSVSSSFAPSAPATSLKVTPVCGSIWILERDLPTSAPGPPGPPIVFMPPPCAAPPRDERKAKIAKGKAIRRKVPAASVRPFVLSTSGGSTVKGTSFFCNVAVSSAVCSAKTADSCRLPSLSMQSTCRPSAEKLTFSTRLFSTASRNCLVDHGVPFGSAAETAVEVAAAKLASPAASAARRPALPWLMSTGDRATEGFRSLWNCPAGEAGLNPKSAVASAFDLS
mmetsp:Transcript_74695/g.136667  ORF Transcript_74695/g.136667 Transcript_74695/m.136667 type:complete len:304 (-) Transcript_74695:173-1084(-)